MARKKVSKVVSNADVAIAEKPKRSSKSVKNSVGIGGGINNFGFPVNQGAPWSTQVSQPTTEFINLRWYFVSNERQLLSEMYVELGLVQAICNIPVNDALRGGITVKSSELDEDQIEQLMISVDRDDDLNTAGQSEIWNRLYGGAGILILTDQDPLTPLDLASIGPDTPLEFRAVDMWELFWNKQSTEGYDPALQLEDFEYYNYYGEEVHKSRVMRLKGLTAPSFNRPRLRGWGFSVVEALVRSINQYLKATTLTFELLDEFKVDVFKIKNLVNTLSSNEAQNNLMNRVQRVNQLKNFLNALVIDKEDDWDHKQINFTGLAEVMQGIRMQIASDMRMPLTKLFGISASGFNSGEDDIEVYNGMVESEVRNKIKYCILRMLEIKCQKLFGFVPSDLKIFFKPLREMSSKEEQEVKTLEFTRALEAFKAGALTLEEFRENCNKAELFTISLDPNFTGYMSDDISEGANNPYDSKDIDNPGANRFDTRKSRATEIGGASEREVKDTRSAPPPMKADPADERVKASPRPPQRRRVNTLEFDRRSYEADGGDAWIDSRRKEFFTDPANPGLWSQAKDRSRGIYGKENWKFQVWWYDKQGGDWSKLAKNADEKIANPGKVDETKWGKAKEIVKKEYGEVRWPVVTTVYKEMGGKFK